MSERIDLEALRRRYNLGLAGNGPVLIGVTEQLPGLITELETTRTDLAAAQKRAASMEQRVNWEQDRGLRFQDERDAAQERVAKLEQQQAADYQYEHEYKRMLHELNAVRREAEAMRQVVELARKLEPCLYSWSHHQRYHRVKEDQLIGVAEEIVESIATLSASATPDPHSADELLNMPWDNITEVMCPGFGKARTDPRDAEIERLRTEFQAARDTANQVEVWREQERRVLQAIGHPQPSAVKKGRVTLFENMRLAALATLAGTAPEENDPLAVLEGRDS